MTARLVQPIDARTERRRESIGGKALSLVRMAALGLPVPPACVIPTFVCDAFHEGRREEMLAAVGEELPEAIARIGSEVGRTYGRGPAPLLVSVRSGAPISMPGMMDTILNLGIDDEVERALVAEAGDPAWVTSMRAGLRTALEPLGAPDPPEEQLRAAIGAVLESWQSPRAIAYRAHHGVPDRPGTAVTIQAMVFGNLDEHSGTGVAFSRNPIDGSPGLHGEWLAQGQGEELVSGEVTPVGLEELRASLPDAYEELAEAAARLEREFGDMQDIEFTIQSGRLYLLQSRSGKRSAEATLRIAVGLAEEEVITRQEALGRVTPEIAASIAERAGASAEGRVLGRGEGASPGFARGIVVTDSDDAARLAESGASVILARPTTDPRDVHGMIAAAAVITEIGGATSHAALVTRDLGKPCVVGCGDGAFANLSGETVLVDGGKGEILAGDADLIKVDAATSRAERILAEWDQERVRGERGADDA